MAIRPTKKMVSFYKILSSQLNELQIKEGQLIYTEDNNRNYLDITDEDRIEIASYSLVQDPEDNYKLNFTYPDGTRSTMNILGVRSVATGRTNGTILVDTNGTTAEVSVAGLGTAAFADRGVPNGLAELDANGIVPASQLPSYVDDVLEYPNMAAFPVTGETGKIYVALDTNLTYRWSGTTYVEISKSLALGETSTTAYRGDRGAAAYAHAVTNKGSAYPQDLYKLASNAEGHLVEATPMTQALFNSMYEIQPSLRVEITKPTRTTYASNVTASEIYQKYQDGYIVYAYYSAYGVMILESVTDASANFITVDQSNNTNQDVYIRNFTIDNNKVVTLSEINIQNDFIITLTDQGSGNYIADKTFSQINTAFNNKKVILLYDGMGLIPVSTWTSSLGSFQGVYYDDYYDQYRTYRYTVSSSNQWSYTEFTLGGLTDIALIRGNTSSNPFIISEHNPGIFYFSNGTNYLTEPYVKWKSTDSVYAPFDDMTVLFIHDTDVADTTTRYIGFAMNLMLGYICDIQVNPTTGEITCPRRSSDILNRQQEQTIIAKKTFNVLPESSITPTTNNQLTNKAYVDTKQNRILAGTTEPTNDIGVDGDVYILYEDF